MGGSEERREQEQQPLFLPNYHPLLSMKICPDISLNLPNILTEYFFGGRIWSGDVQRTLSGIHILCFKSVFSLCQVVLYDVLLQKITIRYLLTTRAGERGSRAIFRSVALCDQGPIGVLKYRCVGGYGEYCPAWRYSC